MMMVWYEQMTQCWWCYSEVVFGSAAALMMAVEQWMMG